MHPLSHTYTASVELRYRLIIDIVMGGVVEDPDYALPNEERAEEQVEESDGEDDDEGSSDDDDGEVKRIPSQESRLKKLEELERKRQAEHKRRYAEV